MSGHHPWSNLSKSVTPEDREHIKVREREALAKAQHEMSRARARTRKETAKSLNLDHPAVAKLEKRADAYLSSLRSHVEAVGGTLTIVAEFPDGEVFIDSLSDIPDYQGNDI